MTQAREKTAAKGTILVVEDDAGTMGVVSASLEGEGFLVLKASTVFKAKGILAKQAPDMVIIDRKLPDGDGLNLCQELRQQAAFAQTPILFLTGKSATTDRVVGLRLGADDYLAKPFSPEELVARVDAVLRRSNRIETRSVLEWDGLRLDLEARKSFIKEKEIDLSSKEFDLLSTLLARKDRVLTRQYLLQSVWRYDGEAELSTRVVDVTVGHLKDKLGAWGKRITAVRGFGYRLDSK